MGRDAPLVTAPPYRIVTERLVVRCWEPRDAPLLKDAVDASLEHLRPWMPWAEHEPQTLEQKVELLRGFRGKFDLGEDFVYGLFDAAETEAVGGSGLHRRSDDRSLEIGYWIRASRAGEGLATEVAAALTRIAFEVCDVDRVEIRTEPTNVRSRRVPEKLGFVEEATLRRRLPGPEPRDAVVYTVFRDDFASTPAAATPLEAYDVVGTRLI